MRIAHVTDLHLLDYLSERFQIDSKTNVASILYDIYKKNVDLTIFTGDYGSCNGLEYLRILIDDLKLKCVFCLGNHDNVEDLLNYRLISNSYEVEKQDEINKIMIITIDSSKGKLESYQIKQINDSIRNDIPNFIFTHYPILKSNKPTFDKEIGFRSFEEVLSVLRNKREAKIFIFAGHYHSYDFIQRNNVKQYINSGALMQINEKNGNIVTESFKYGYSIIDIIENSINYQTVQFDGYGVGN